MADVPTPADAVHNWRVEAGERERYSHTVLDLEGEPFELTGWEADVKVRTRPGGDLLHTFPANDVFVDTENNAVVLTIPAPTSLAWVWTSGWYRVVITDPFTSGDDLAAYRVLSGTIVIEQD